MRLVNQFVDSAPQVLCPVTRVEVIEFLSVGLDDGLANSGCLVVTVTALSR